MGILGQMLYFRSVLTKSRMEERGKNYKNALLARDQLQFDQTEKC